MIERCVYCFRELLPVGVDHPHAETADHVVPKCKGGKSKVPCCFSCNNTKGRMDAGTFIYFMHWARQKGTIDRQKLIDVCRIWHACFEEIGDVMEGDLQIGIDVAIHVYNNPKAMGYVTCRDLSRFQGTSSAGVSGSKWKRQLAEFEAMKDLPIEAPSPLWRQ